MPTLTVPEFISAENYVENARLVNNTRASGLSYGQYAQDGKAAELMAEIFIGSSEGDEVVARAIESSGVANDESIVHERDDMDFNFRWLMSEVGRLSVKFADQPSASKLQSADMQDLARFVYDGGIRTYLLARQVTSGVNSPVSKNLKWLATFLRCPPEDTKKELEAMPPGFGAVLVPKIGSPLTDIRIQKIVGK